MSHEGSPSGDARTKAIFSDALDLQGPARTAHLDSACAADPDLRRRVEALLAAAEKPDRFLSDPTVDSGAHASGLGGTGSARGESPGDRIGPYKLLQIIGEGGFGTVYMADQERPVRRRVALKIIKLGMDTRAVVARFEQERQALAVMEHAGIAKVLDAGATDTGRPYFVMELVKGDPITRYCDRERLSIPQRLDLFMQVCRAVQHAHTKGIIHRDIKPSNVLVATQDGHPVARVIDFGIAKATDRQLTEKTVFTEFHQLIGTPEYMSPEQAEGSLDLDTRTDIYSLGVLLYELLTGSTPFDPKRLRSAAFGEMQRVIREVEPPRPSTRLTGPVSARESDGQAAGQTLASIAACRATEPRRLGTVVRGELDWITMKALDKDRGRRYGTAEALAADVAAHLAAQPVAAAPPGAAYRVRKFVRRHRVGVAAWGAVAAALVLGMVGTGAGFLRARDDRDRALAAEAEQARLTVAAQQSAQDALQEADRAEREARRAQKEAAVSASVNKLMTQMLEKADRGRQGGRADITVREVMDAAAADLVQGSPRYEPEVQASVAKTIGETYRALALYDQAEPMLRLHADRQKDLHGDKSPEYAGALNDLGAAVRSRGRLDEAADFYARAREILTAAGLASEREMAQLRLNAGALAFDLQKIDDAEADFKEAAAYFERTGTTADEPYLAALTNLANVAYVRRDLAASEAALRRVLAAEQKAYGENDGRLVRTMHNISVVQLTRGDYDAAEPTVRAELQMARRLLGDKHESVGDALGGLGVILESRRDFAGAEAAAREAIPIFQATAGDSHPTTGEAWNRLGTALEAQARFPEARQAYQAAADVFERAQGAAPAQKIFAHYKVGLVLERSGDYAAAEPILRAQHEASVRANPEGDRRAWVTHAIASALGGALAGQAADESLSADARTQRLTEAESFATPAAERLLATAETIPKRQRAALLELAVGRAIRVYELWNQLEPTPAHAQALDRWREQQKKLADDHSR
jgi:serine/threonine protein kinase